MTTPETDVVQFRLNRASETMDEARDLATRQHWNGAANRLYYACYYAVTAWMASRALTVSKHTHVRSTLNRDLVKPGLISEALGNFFNDLYELRTESDYLDFKHLEASDVEALVPQAENFIRTIKGLL
ncbi:MAG TPA: HEPN domain-containing protein [Oscillatoriaceae cyanobacterium]